MPAKLSLTPDLALTGHGAAWLPRADAIVVADVHIGYARAARRRGGWLPAGEDAAAVAARTLDAARAVGASHLVIAGDLRHSTRDVDDAELADVAAYLATVARDLRVTLVPGNHDRDAGLRYAALGIAIATGPLALGAVDVTHEPPPSEPARWTVCGHLHPSTTVRDATGAGARFPCAMVGPMTVVLPAFGEWQGGVATSRLRPRLFDGEWRSYPLAGGEIFPPR